MEMSSWELDTGAWRLSACRSRGSSELAREEKRTKDRGLEKEQSGSQEGS